MEHFDEMSFTELAAKSIGQEREIEFLRTQLAEAQAEIQEQSRLNGMGSEREAKLQAKLNEAYSEIARLINLDKRTNETVGLWMEKNQLLKTENTILSQQLLATQAHAARLVEALANLNESARMCQAGEQDKDSIQPERTRAIEILSTPINLDALHEERAQVCDEVANRLHQVCHHETGEAGLFKRIVRDMAAAHRAKKEGK